MERIVRMPGKRLYPIRVELAMNLKKIIPAPTDMLREALIVLTGAVIAAVIVRNAPKGIKDYINFYDTK